MLKNINSKSKNIISYEIINDSRMFPLFNETTKLLLQFFVLEIKNIKLKEKEYKIIYGWCLPTTREEISDEIYCSDFTKVYTSLENIYSVGKISIYNYPSNIIELINELLLGKSLKNANDRLKTNKLKFDVHFTREFAIRPIIFNETNNFISRNPYKKNALTSPYKDTPSFTLSICNLDKVNTISNNNKVDNHALLALLKHLHNETTLPFLTSGSTRFGNIEFINTQCVNEFEVGYVNLETNKEEVKIEYKKVPSCKKITVFITPNIHTCSKNLLINCYLENGGQVILDECKKTFHQPEKLLIITFESMEQISGIAISIWKEENDTFQIWYKYGVTLLRQIAFNMGIVGLHGTVQSPWLKEIEESNSKTKEKITEIEKISKTSYQKPMTIGEYALDPWVNTDRDFAEYINQINPKKSEAEFFPQGWEVETQQHGAISFLEWFKEQTKDAQKVFLQDPFYDTLGLEFLVRTTNAETNFIILTCTQTSSMDDKANNTANNSEPNRASRIKSFISSHPSLFNSLMLNVYDLRSTGGGDTNLLHDRYILIFKNDILKKGFHLSNSIQGATKKQPLLITPIPQDVLRKVDSHINDLINKTNKTNSTVKIINLHDYNSNRIDLKKDTNEEKKFNEVILNKLKNDISTQIISEDIISTFISNALSRKIFPEFWATFGYFLSTTSNNDKIISSVKLVNNPNFAIELRKYIESSITEKYPFGFTEKRGNREYDFQFLFVDNFKTIVEKVLQHSDYISEIYGFGNWGVYYGCNLLLNISFDEYLNLIEFVKGQYVKNKNKDLKDNPLSKLSTIIFTKLLKHLLWGHNADDLNQKLLSSNNSVLKAIATAIFISDILKENSNITFDEFKNQLTSNLSVDNLLNVFMITLLNHRFRNKHADTALESNILSAISFILIENYSKEQLQNIFEQILSTYYPLIEKKFTEKVLIKLEEANLIDTKTIFELWSGQFLILIDNFDSIRNYSGIIDLTGWSFQIIEKEIKNNFVDKLEKILKNELNEIRKPFRQETNEWNRTFERVLLIKTVLMISVLYGQEKNDYNNEIRIINKISQLEENYKYFKEYSQVCIYSKKIENKYKENSNKTPNN